MTPRQHGYHLDEDDVCNYNIPTMTNLHTTVIPIAKVNCSCFSVDSPLVSTSATCSSVGQYSTTGTPRFTFSRNLNVLDATIVSLVLRELYGTLRVPHQESATLLHANLHTTSKPPQPYHLPTCMGHRHVLNFGRGDGNGWMLLASQGDGPIS